MVVMGRVIAPFGIQGWIKVYPYSERPGSLIGFRHWWVGGAAGGWKRHSVDAARLQGPLVVARILGCETRDAAILFKGCDVAVPRSELPALDPGEHYREDLVGFDVVNRAGEHLGRVEGFLETGANDVMVVGGTRERLIPMVAPILDAIDAPARRITVDWGLDY